MPALPNDLDLDSGDCREEGTRAHSNVPFVEVGNVVEAIDLVDSNHAFLLHHGQGSAWAFLGWLQEQSDTLIAGNFRTIRCNYGSSCHQAGHVAIVTAHVCKGSLRLVGQALVVLRHRQAIKVGPECDHIASSFGRVFGCFSSTHDIDDETGASTLLHRFSINSKAGKSVCKQLLRLNLLKAAFWVLVQFAAQSNHLVDFAPIFIHLCTVGFVQGREVCLFRATKATFAHFRRFGGFLYWLRFGAFW